MPNNLSAQSISLQEINNKESLFPSNIRNNICQSIETISIEEIEELFDRHESDPDNFDSRIEKNLRNLCPDININANHRISDQTKFNSDLVIVENNNVVCLEIEKGYLARFEFDILKMQAFASNRLLDNPSSNIYGAFIVPIDNVVANHISGNSRESSYRYLSRLSRLISQIDPLILKDILIVGYSTSDISEEDKQPISKNRKRHSNRDAVISGKEGIVDENIIREKLHGYPLDLVLKIRKDLIDRIDGLREKLNPSSRYLGYGSGNRSDALYIYIQKKQLILDIRVSKDEAEILRQKGFKVKPRKNFQDKAGWLTGVSIPHDQEDVKPVVDLAILALEV